jgi:hypothetical protein
MEPSVSLHVALTPAQQSALLEKMTTSFDAVLGSLLNVDCERSKANTPGTCAPTQHRWSICYLTLVSCFLLDASWF